MSKQTYSKTKGREAENAVCAYLVANGYPHAERRRLAGVNDKGDVAGVAGRVIEVKDEKATDLAGWVTELQTEIANARAQTGTVVRKRKGYSYDKNRPETLDNVGEWYAVLPFRLLLDLWRQLDGIDQTDTGDESA